MQDTRFGVSQTMRYKQIELTLTGEENVYYVLVDIERTFKGITRRDQELLR